MSSEPLRESETVELKKSLAELKEGLVSIAAILNKHGAGELWFGVAPSGKPVGLDVTDKTLRDLSQAIAAHIEPKIYPQVTTQTVAGKTCIHIRFDGQNAPYFAHGRAYMRVADEDRQLSAAELEAIIVDKNQNALRWDTRALDKPWPDLEIKKVKSFAKRAGLQWDTLGDDDEMRLQHALTKLELLQKSELCNAARLFFAKEPIQCFGKWRGCLLPALHGLRFWRGGTRSTKKHDRNPLKTAKKLQERLQVQLQEALQEGLAYYWNTCATIPKPPSRKWRVCWT